MLAQGSVSSSDVWEEQRGGPSLPGGIRAHTGDRRSLSGIWTKAQAENQDSWSVSPSPSFCAIPKVSGHLSLGAIVPKVQREGGSTGRVHSVSSFGVCQSKAIISVPCQGRAGQSPKPMLR